MSLRHRLPTVPPSDARHRPGDERPDAAEQAWNRSASAYVSVETTASRYARVAVPLVRMADIRRGMHVLDLACGPGTVTAEILRQIGGEPLSIIAVDASDEMLQIARAHLQAPSIQFVQARAEQLATVLSRRVDRVLCSAAFWQMPMRQVLDVVRDLLAEDGRFVLSVPDLSPADVVSDRRQLYARSKLAWMVLDERACRGCPLEPRPSARPRVSQADVVIGLAVDRGFRVVASQTLPVQSSVADTLAFLQMPTMLNASPLLAGLPFEEREDILRAVAAQLQDVDANIAPKLWRLLALAPV